MPKQANPLVYKILSECSTTKARVGTISLLHSDVNTPVFMPVGTQVIIKLIFYNCSRYQFV